MKRIVSMLLALCLLLSLCPAYAGATEELGQVHVIVENTTFLEKTADSRDGPAWTGTLVDTWVELTADHNIGTCVESAVTAADSSYTVVGVASGYISDINGLAEMDGGQSAGWMVTLNDWFINEGVDSFSVANGNLEAGDEIRMMYTCSGMGTDLGGSFGSTETRLAALTFSVGTLDVPFAPDTHSYTLTVPAGTTELTVTPTAMNKNYQVRTRLQDEVDTWYKRSEAIPVSGGTVIEVVCGDPSWPSMSASSEPSIYSVTVETEALLYTKPTYGSFPISGDKISRDCGTSLPYSLYRDSAGAYELTATQETFDNLRFIPDNAASEGAVALYYQSDSEGGWLWGIDFVGFGSGRLVYTDTDGTTYSVAIESVLPERGFSTAPTLTEASYMKTGDSYTIGQPFYYVYPAGVTIESAAFTQDFNNAGVPECVESRQYSSNVWQFTITGDLETYPEFYLHVTFHTDWEKELPSYGTSGWIMLYSGVERLGYRLVWPESDGGYSWDPDSELLDFGIVGLTNGVLFYREKGSEKEPLCVTDVAFVPDERTAADAVVPTHYRDYVWKLKFQSPGSGSLRCTDVDGAVWDIPIRIEADSKLTQLGTPTELVWGREYNYSTEFVERPGVLSAKVTQPTQNRYQWEVYRVVENGDDELVDVQSWDYGSGDELTYIDDASGFANGYAYDAKDRTDDWCIPSGTYYFKVYAEGDDVTYCNSEVAVSDTWTYTQPEAHLAAPTGLYWDEDKRMAHWTDSNTEVEPCEFELAWFFQREDGTWREIGGSWGACEGHQDRLEDYVLEREGAGNYAFRVRALSPDITEICNSVWSELSPVLEVSRTTAQVVESLDGVKTDYDKKTTDGTLTREEDRDALRDAVASIGTNSLSTAMAADTGDDNGNGTVDRITALEALVGGPAAVAVSDGLRDKLVASKVSIVGANLNTTGHETATLNIAPAAGTEVIGTQYQNTITFSMELENGPAATNGHQQLAVPVQITIPVPADIDPAFLVILHHRQDGTAEEVILPRIVTRDGTTCAVFVITSFSNFTLAEQSYRMDGGKLSVPVEDGVSQVLAALYGGSGQLLGCVSAEAADGAAVLELTEIRLSGVDQAALAGAKLKVFYLNADHSPARAALEIPLQ